MARRLNAKVDYQSKNETDKWTQELVDYLKRLDDRLDVAEADVDVLQLYRKNLILNGNFDVWQRGTSFTSPVHTDYTADRWQIQYVGSGVVDVLKSTDVPTYDESGVLSSSSLHIDVTTADASIASTDVYGVVYPVEGFDYARITGGNAVLSFWVKATKTGIYCVSIRNSGIDRSYIREYTVNTADEWEKKTLIFPLTETGGTWDYTNGAGLYITFALAAGSNYQGEVNTWNSANDYATNNQVNALDNVSNNFRIAQVQLEQGSVATNFEFRHYAEELALCQRYYEQWDRDTDGDIYIGTGGQAVTSTTVRHHINYRVEKRAAPSLSYNNLVTTRSNGVNAAISSVNWAGIGIRSVRGSCTTTGMAAGNSTLLALGTGGYIKIDAEL